jgi:hypothetical protein
MKVADLFESRYGNVEAFLKYLDIDHTKIDQEWSGSLACTDKGLTSLKGSPKHVSKHFYCNINELTSLEYAPKTIGGNFNCSQNKLTSLHNIHKQIESIGGEFKVYDNHITSCLLGLLKIKKLKHLDMADQVQVEDIINKYLPEGDIIECQAELIEAGFDEYAKL